MRCPTCLDIFTWSESNVHVRTPGGDFAPLDLTQVNPDERLSTRRRAYVKCANSGDVLGRRVEDHYLPLLLADHQPIILGFVGGSGAGKTHLLASMVAEIHRDGLRTYGLRWEPLDPRLDVSYLKTHVAPLLAGNVLQPTSEDVVQFVDAFLVQGQRSEPRAVAFFDIAGGDLQAEGPEGQFVLAAHGLFYIVDPAYALGLRTAAGAPGPAFVDPAIQNILKRVRPEGAPFSDMPAGIVLVKSDRVRFRSPIDDWIHQPTCGPLDAGAIAAESRDAFALLYACGAMPALAPASTHRHCTLHFVSATGSDSQQGRFNRPVRFRRVLEPLVAMLGMAGVIPISSPREDLSA